MRAHARLSSLAEDHRFVEDDALAHVAVRLRLAKRPVGLRHFGIPPGWVVEVGMPVDR